MSTDAAKQTRSAPLLVDTDEDAAEQPLRRKGSPLLGAAAAKVRSLRRVLSNVSSSLIGNDDAEVHFEYKLSTDFVHKNHLRWVKQTPVEGETDPVDNADAYQQQSQDVKVAVAAAHLYGALKTPGAKLMWSRCLDQYHKGPAAVKKALLFDLRVFSLYESPVWNFAMVVVTLCFCLLGFFQLPLVVSAYVWLPAEIFCLLCFCIDTVAYARVRGNHFKRGWFVARMLLQALFVADIIFRLSTDTAIVFALAIRPTYLITRNRDIRIVVVGTMRSVANLALVAVIFVFVLWSSMYGYLLFDFCAPGYGVNNQSLQPDSSSTGATFNSTSCSLSEHENFTLSGTNFGTFGAAFSSLLELLTAPSFLIALQQPYVDEASLSILFFMALQILGRFVLLRVVIAVGIHTFKKMILQRYRRRTRKQMQTLHFVFDLLSSINDEAEADEPGHAASTARARASTVGTDIGRPPSSFRLPRRRFVTAEQWMDTFMLVPVCKLKYRRQLGSLLWNCTIQVTILAAFVNDVVGEFLVLHVLVLVNRCIQV